MNIVVVGAGTAGLLAALYANKFCVGANVIIVYDDKTPIIGVGEGTTPNFTSFLEMIDISTEELIQNCEATIKNGIKFTNWKGDGSHYYHTFGAIYDGDKNSTLETYAAALSKGLNLDKFFLTSILSEHNKIPILNTKTSFKEDQLEPHALHFNAKKLAEYLKLIAVNRGVKTIVGKIEEVLLDNNDNVAKIILDTKQEIETGFVFDCTGFARVFVDKIYKSPFRSYEKSLPVKKAMPFFLDKDDTTPPFTEAIAMKYGWMWKIPVGNRYGCGYVFDSNYITDEKAYEEICQITKQKPHVPRTISFKPGYYTKPLNKNTLALGLSHGFLEPLEATSLMLVILMLVNLRMIGPHTDHDANIYNEIATKDVENIVDMLYIHYLTPRKDTDFWKNFKNNNPMPEHTSETIRKLNNFSNSISDSSPFKARNFLVCMDGVKNINNDIIENNKKNSVSDEKLQQTLKRIESVCLISKKHDDYLKYWSNK